MKVAIILLFILIETSVYAQISRFESTKVNDQKAIKIITARNNVFAVAAGRINEEDTLVLAVGHQHGVGTCSGALGISKSRVMYNSPTRPEHNFTFLRSDLKVFEINNWKSFGKVIYQQISIKTKDKDYNFYPWAESPVYNLNTEDFPFVLGWFGVAISNFDEAWKAFETTYKKNIPSDTLIGAEGQKFQILDRYDKFKDRTTYVTSAMHLSGTHYSIIFQAGFWHEGTTPSTPQNAILYIDADDSVRRLFKSDRSLIFLVDGARLKLGEMEWLDSRYIPGGRYYSGTVIDQLGIVVPWVTLVKIANSSSVEFQVGTVEARLDAVHRDALKMLISKASVTNSAK